MTLAVGSPEMILFDLDGTLVDSVPDLAAAIDATMRDLGRRPCGEAAVRDWVGNGVERLVKRALVGAIEGEPERAELDRALPVFMAHYHAANGRNACLYPAVRETLQRLAGSGCPLGLVTNKAEAFTLPLLEQLGIIGYFGVVVSGDSLPTKKPDPAPLLHAARELGTKPERSLLVGDSRSDVRAARAAGFAVICVSYGYNHGEDISEYGPDAVIDSLNELPGLLTSAA